MIKIKMKEENISIDKLLLDANNLRDMESDKQVTVKKMLRVEVQDELLAKISKETIELKESISKIGFLYIDSVVVVKAEENSEMYIVVEGNRRIASVKGLLKEIRLVSALDIVPELIQSLKSIKVQVIEGTYETTNYEQRIIQGTRHIAGTKNWTPYGQAQAVVDLVDVHKINLGDAAEIIGLGRNIANRRRKAYYGLHSMSIDDNVNLKGDSPGKYFSYFEEILGNKELRRYYDWSDKDNCFRHEHRLYSLYKMIGLMSDDKNKEKQIPGALDIRKLPRVLNNSQASKLLDRGESIHEAYAVAVVNESSVTTKDYKEQLKRIHKELTELPALFVRHMSDKERKLLKAILKTSKDSP